MAAYVTDQGVYVVQDGTYLDDSNGLDCCCGGCWFESTACFCETTATVYLPCGIGIPPGSNAFTWQGVCYGIGPIVSSLPPGAVVADVPLVFHDDCSACCTPIECCSDAACLTCPGTLTVLLSGLTSASDASDCLNVACGGALFQMARAETSCLWRIVPNTDPVIDENCYPDSFFDCIGAMCEFRIFASAFINCLPDTGNTHYYRMSIHGTMPDPTSPPAQIPLCTAAICENECGLQWTVTAETARFGDAAPCPCPSIGFIVTGFAGLASAPSVSVS